MHLNSKNDFSKFAFIFDHDGVLADTESIHETAWNQMCQKHGVIVDRNTYDNLVRGRSTKDAVANIFPNYSGQDQIKFQDEKSIIYDDLVVKFLKPTPGVLEFINKANLLGIKIAIASAGKRKRIEYSISKFNLKSKIDTFLTVEDVTKNKPDPEIYIKTIERLGMKPDLCVIFEDSPTGLEAGYYSGAKVIFTNTSSISYKSNVYYQMEMSSFENCEPKNLISELFK